MKVKGMSSGERSRRNKGFFDYGLKWLMLIEIIWCTVAGGRHSFCYLVPVWIVVSDRTSMKVFNSDAMKPNRFPFVEENIILYSLVV